MKRSLAGRRRPISRSGALAGIGRSSLQEAPRVADEETLAVARAVREGLTSHPKRLPPWLFYDADGSRLFEQITELPEYYLTRAESSILSKHGNRIVRAALDGSDRPPLLSLLELGAGTAVKTQILLGAAIAELRAWGGRCFFVPVDISGTVLDAARDRLAASLPELSVQPIVGNHEAACVALATLTPPRLALFLGSSMGNFDDTSNITLFRSVRESLGPGDAFLIGADRRNPIDEILAAYDDAAGVTAAFNRNILIRINRELGGQFDPDFFSHVARWNERESRVEMHLSSTRAQRVPIRALGMTVVFGRGETIHTESSIKYSDARIRRILDEAGFAHERLFLDDGKRFGLHLARPRSH